MSPRSTLALMSLLTAGLGACATQHPEAPMATPAPTFADRHRITVAETGERHDVVVMPGATGLSPTERADLVRFARTYVNSGQGPLVLSAPSGGANAEAALLLAQDTRMALAEAGVALAAIASSAYDASGQEAAPIVLSFTRYEAVAPDCRPLWEQNLAQDRHLAYESFGCATNANLAAMIEQPGDLLAPRAETPRDSARRAVVLDAYRQGKPTHAERSSDERVAISNAVQ